MSPFPGLSSDDGFGRIAGVCGPYGNEQANPIRKVIITPSHRWRDTALRRAGHRHSRRKSKWAVERGDGSSKSDSVKEFVTVSDLGITG